MQKQVQRRLEITECVIRSHPSWASVVYLNQHFADAVVVNPAPFGHPVVALLWPPLSGCLISCFLYLIIISPFLSGCYLPPCLFSSAIHFLDLCLSLALPILFLFFHFLLSSFSFFSSFIFFSFLFLFVYIIYEHPENFVF